MMKPLLMLLFLALAGCSGKEQKSQVSEANVDTLKRDTMLTKDEGAVDLDTNSTMFFKHSAYGGMMEVESSHKIWSVTLDSAVKNFAQVMLTDHGNANKELKALAKSKGYNLPTLLPSHKIAMIGKMETMKDEGKNDYYIQLMVEEHVQALTLFRKASRFEDKEIREFASALIPILETHYHHIKQLQTEYTKDRTNVGDDPLKLSDKNKQN